MRLWQLFHLLKSWIWMFRYLISEAGCIILHLSLLPSRTFEPPWWVSRPWGERCWSCCFAECCTSAGVSTAVQCCSALKRRGKEHAAMLTHWTVLTELTLVNVLSYCTLLKCSTLHFTFYSTKWFNGFSLFLTDLNSIIENWCMFCMCRWYKSY